MRYFVPAFVIGIVFAGSVSSQTQYIQQHAVGSCDIWGELIAPTNAEEGMEVVIVGKKPTPPQRSPVMQGTFTFHSVPAGLYKFKVLDRSGRVIYTDTRSLKGTGDQIGLRIPDIGRGASFANTISVETLRQKSDRRVTRAIDAASKASRAGNPQKSLEYLDKALAINPELAKVHAYMAVLCFHLGRYDDALRHGQKAFELNPDLPETAAALATVSLVLTHYREAETVARRALENQAHDPGLLVVLAVSLISQQRNLDEALVLVQQASAEFAPARLYAAAALAKIGMLTDAANQVRELLNSSPQDCLRSGLETSLADLERAQPHASETATLGRP